jgi:hypothetical protein
MNIKNISLKINSKIYDIYQEFCKQKGWIVSRHFDILMEKPMIQEI